ncbi:MAG TPA: glycosyltransferase family 39 protein [Vicinamibacterales bacterium]|nr:glycosyltransferase family 39 protein [Vicinamibacterales bacterium]
MRTELSPAATRVLLVIVLAVGAALRFTALSYGLPFVYNPDEVAIMNRALAFATNGLNPHNFLYPTFYFYVLFAWEVLGYGVGRVFGLFDSLAAFERSYFADPTWIFLVGRKLTALCGVATIAATYALGRRLSGRTAGVIAAAVLAVSPIAVRDAHYVKHDVPVTLLIVLAILGLFHATTPRDHAEAQGTYAQTLRRWAGCGAVAGLAMSTHYYAIFVALPIAIAALWPATPNERVADRLRLLANAGVAATIAFVAGSPFLIVEPARVIADVIGNRQIVMDRATETAGLFGSLGFYLQTLWRDGLGVIAALCGAIGVVAMFRTDGRRAGLLLAFPVAFLLFIGNTFPATRYLNPVLPFAAVLAGAGAAALIARVARGGVLVAASLVVAGLLMSGGVASARSDAFFLQTDTRTQAYEWIAKNLPAESSVLVQPYSVPLRQSRAGLVEALRATQGDETRASTRFRKQLDLDPYPAPAYRTIYLGDGGLDQDKIYVSPSAFADETLAPLRALAVTHVILKRYNQPDVALASLDRALAKDAQLIVTFSPYRAAATPTTRAAVSPFLHNTDATIDAALERPGPIVEIWRLR